MDLFLKNIDHFKIFSLTALALALFSLFLFPTDNQACAGGAPASAPSSCDPVYMTSLEEAGWLQGQREIIQNQNYIVKPDSVLEYTCFDQALIHTVAGPISGIFSDEAFGVESPPPMIDRVENILLPQAEGYLAGGENFSHEFGGGTFIGSGGADAFGASSNPCGVMGNIWHLAKSENFIADPANDGFYTYLEYAMAHSGGDDPRWAPRQTDGPTEGQWVDAILLANNIEAIGQLPPNDHPAGYPYRDPHELVAVTYVRPRLEEGASTPPVMTGVPVHTTSPAGAGGGYPDGLCTNPGMTFVGGACL